MEKKNIPVLKAFSFQWQLVHWWLLWRRNNSSLFLSVSLIKHKSWDITFMIIESFQVFWGGAEGGKKGRKKKIRQTGGFILKTNWYLETSIIYFLVSFLNNLYVMMNNKKKIEQPLMLIPGQYSLPLSSKWYVIFLTQTKKRNKEKENYLDFKIEKVHYNLENPLHLCRTF